MCALLASCTGGAGNSEGFTIGGTVTGLNGTGLVLADDGADNLAITGNGAFTFATALRRSSPYAVTVVTQPTGPAQNCVVTGGTGTAAANVTTVAVACTNTATTYSIGGTVSGLAGTGLVLKDNGGDNLSVTANGDVYVCDQDCGRQRVQRDSRDAAEFAGAIVRGVQRSGNGECECDQRDRNVHEYHVTR